MDNSTRFNRQLGMGAVALLFIGGVLAILMSFLVLRLVFMKMIGVGTGAMAASIAQASHLARNCYPSYTYLTGAVHCWA